MRFHVISDIHLDTYRTEQRVEFFRKLEEAQLRDQVGILIVAGDVCSEVVHDNFGKLVFARLCSMYPKVVYVMGNHEFWGHDFKTIRRLIDRWSIDPDLSNLHVLSDGGFTSIEGQRFMGGTLWYPKPGLEDEWTKNMYPDFRAIRDFEPEVYARHADFLNSLEVVQPTDVVISHMAPLEDSIDAQWAGEPTNRFFCPDIRHHFKQLPKLWIHGHTHCAFDYKFKGMRVYANPYGYPGEGANRNFWQRILVEVDSAPAPTLK